MTRQELAALLNGRECGREITPAEAQAAKDAGLVVLFGASDDSLELRGAIHDEVGAYEGCSGFLDTEGWIRESRDNDWCDNTMERWFERRRSPNKIGVSAHWDQGGYSWVIEADCPYAPFEILEDGEPYCLGAVLRLWPLIIQDEVVLSQDEEVKERGATNFIASATQNQVQILAQLSDGVYVPVATMNWQLGKAANLAAFIAGSLNDYGYTINDDDIDYMGQDKNCSAEAASDETETERKL